MAESYEKTPDKVTIPITARDEVVNGTDTVGDTFTFPGSLTTEWKHVIYFRRYEYSRNDLKSDSTQKATGAQIALPVPLSLGTSYGATWNSEDMGAISHMNMDLAAKTFDNWKNSSGGGFSLEDFQKSLGGIINSLNADNMSRGVKNLAQAAAIDFGQKLPGYSTLSRAAGVAVNPFQAMIYSSPEFRQFNFSYKLIPSNLKEANTIRSIIREFKIGMHPNFEETFNNNLFKYPDVWHIDLPDTSYRFKFATCVLTNVGVEYHGEGTKSYFSSSSGEIPFSTQLDLSFQEVAILTREDIVKDGY